MTRAGWLGGSSRSLSGETTNSELPVAGNGYEWPISLSLRRDTHPETRNYHSQQVVLSLQFRREERPRYKKKGADLSAPFFILVTANVNHIRGSGNSP